MTYNIHPIFVHFPIALLFIYSIVKVLPLQRWMPSVSWKAIERFLLFFGVLGAFAALATGETAEHLSRPNHQLVEMHSTFGAIATWVYGILLFGEIVSIINTSYQSLLKVEKFQTILLKLENIFYNQTFSKLLAVVGFIAIFVTGLLGGAMVYGTSADPVAGLVVRLLGITL